MELHKIKITNFKGLKSFEYDFEGNDVAISGINGVGKTTIMDAVSWILTDKDSKGASTESFTIKPLTEDGEEIHRIETIVSIELRDKSWEDPVELKKVFKEKWTKHSSSEHEVLTGHTTKHFINGFAKKEKEYKEFVATNIISESMLWLLSDPMAFNALPWKKAREILNNMADPVSDYEIIEREGFDSLSEIMSKEASIDDLKKKISDQKSEMEKEKEAIPHRIDELYNSIKDAEEISDDDIKEVEKKMTSISDEIFYLKKETTEGQREQRLHEIDQETKQIQNTITKNIKAEKETIEASIATLESELDYHIQEKESVEKTLEAQEEELKTVVDEIEEKKKEYFDEKDNMYTEENLVYCPECKQIMPKEMRAYKVEDLNEKKAAQMQKIISAGKNLKTKKRSILESIQAKNVVGNNHLTSIHNLEERIENKKKRYENVDDTISKDLNDRMDALKKERTKILDEDRSYRKDKGKQKIKELEEEKIVLANKKSELERMKAEYESARSSRERIKQLEKEEKEIAKKLEKLAHQLYEAGLAEIKKAENIQENINSKFNLARFNLFKVQVNGGIKPVCETTFNGVPFNRGLNNGSKINVGLDIISTLSDHYGIKCPTFIDNAESVIDIIETDSQQIHLVVAKNKKLKTTMKDAQ